MSEMVYMYGFGFGGPPGRNVTVHVTYGGATGSGANVSCTNGKKTFYGVTDTNGNFTFKLAKGTWTITADKSGSTSSVNVDITGDCTVNVSLFAATINITYPKGYTCTAKNGTTTLTAPDTSGTWKCVVPNAGTWTLTAKDGSYSVSKSVSITTNNQNISITIVAELVIFRNGSLQNGFSTTGLNNWTAATAAVHFSITDGNLVAKTSGYSNISLIVKPSVDITPYNTLKLVVSRANGGGSLHMGTGDSGTDDSFTVKASKSEQPFSKQTFNIDISSVNKKQYVKCTGFEGGTATITIYEIVLLR